MQQQKFDFLERTRWKSPLNSGILWETALVYICIYPESKSENNFSSFSAESQIQSKGKLNVIFPPKKLLKLGQIALFSIVRLKQGTSIKTTLLLNRDFLNYLAHVNK